MDVTIRTATLGDVPRIVELGLPLVEEVGERSDPQAGTNLVEEYVQHGRSTVLVAEGASSASLLVGALLARIGRGRMSLHRRDAFIHAVGVVLELRRTRVGGDLIKAAEQWATDNGATGLVMCIPPTSPLAGNMERHGFEPAETWYRKGLAEQEGRPANGLFNRFASGPSGLFNRHSKALHDKEASRGLNV